ncbi:MAG: ribosome-associated translation inhibitor RaiA [SAR202 cluster bacterium]|nr:ribosome-associated translation inhibitor RaiA [SAR202 cluster bacterium]
MDLQIYAKDIELNVYSEEYINKKLSKLERHLKAVTGAKVEVEKTSARNQADQFVAQCTVTVNGRTLRAQESGPSLFEAVDVLADVMDRQIRRYKTKYYRTSQARRTARAGQRKEAVPDAAGAATAEQSSEDFGKVVRVKRFKMPAMNVEEAVTQMELLSHDFFFFFNAEANQFNVLYRRQEGDYGLIEPELV